MVTISTHDEAWLSENHPESVPNEVYLKSDNVDSMDNSDISMYTKSDPFDPFELAYATDEENKMMMMLALWKMILICLFSYWKLNCDPLLTADNFSHIVPPVNSASDLMTSHSITATRSSHATPPPKSGDLTSPVITTTCSGYVTPLPDATVRTSDLFPPTLPHASFLLSATSTTLTTSTVTRAPSNLTGTLVSVLRSLTTLDSGMMAAIGPSASSTPSRTQSPSSLGSTRKVLSPITQILTYPSVRSSTQSTKKSTKGSCACVLTSSEAIKIMKAKEKSKMISLTKRIVRSKGTKVAKGKEKGRGKIT